MGAATKEQNKYCAQPSVRLHRCISILPNDYNVMENIPKINGVDLKGEMKSEQLSLLSSKPDDYTDIALNEAKKENGYMVVLMPGENKPKRVSLTYLCPETERGFQTVEDVDMSAVGSYQFLEKK